MEKPELILHIGSPKTGSSSLQWIFENNRDFLKEAGVFYPLSVTYTRYGVEIRDAIEKESVTKILNSDNYLQLKKKTEQINKHMLEEFKKSKCCKILASEELLFVNIPLTIWDDEVNPYQLDRLFDEFYTSKISRINELFDKFNVKIVCYLRRQDLFFESLYNQRIKNGRIVPMSSLVSKYNEAFVKINNYDFSKFEGQSELFHLSYQYSFADTKYYDILNTWANEFGRENLIIKPFEKAQLGSGLVKDFFVNVLNIEPDKLIDLKEQHVNERISRDVLEYVNKFNVRPRLDAGELVDVSKRLGDSGKYHSYFTVEERTRLLNYHSEGNEKIAREYLNREDGKLFYEEVEMTEPEPYPGLTAEKIELLDKEFSSLPLNKLIYKIIFIFNATKSRAESLYSIEKNHPIITKIKVYVLTISAFSRRIMTILINKVTKRLKRT